MPACDALTLLDAAIAQSRLVSSQPALPPTGAALAALSREIAAQLPGLPLPGAGDTLARWRCLARIAAHDVCLVKILEAHYDALAILHELDGQPPSAGTLLAVWAAEPPDAVARLDIATPGGAAHDDAPHGATLHGRKAWCSGADVVDAALVTVHRGDARALVLLSMDARGVSQPADAWPAVGMARVVSGALHFDAVAVQPIGAAGAYLARPGFWHGGAGIAACWYGATCAIADTLRVHPRVQRDPHAAAHLGAIDIGIGAVQALLRQTAALIDADPAQPHIDAVTRVRSATERLASDVIDRVGRALGAGPLCTDAAHAQRCADLSVFIRQSHAEQDWAALGKAAAGNDLGWTL